MKSCRCLEINPNNPTEKCLLPWGHDDIYHISGSSIWKSDGKKKYKEKQTV